MEWLHVFMPWKSTDWKQPIEGCRRDTLVLSLWHTNGVQMYIPCMSYLLDICTCLTRFRTTQEKIQHDEYPQVRRQVLEAVHGSCTPRSNMQECNFLCAMVTEIFTLEASQKMFPHRGDHIKK